MTAMQNTLVMQNLFSAFGGSSRKAEIKQEVTTVTDLINTQQIYETAHTPLSDTAFFAIRDQIAQTLKDINPSGSNKRLDELDAAIRQILLKHEVPPVQYWGEVWRRAGRKDLSSYNK